jgi:hypothetical protein
MLEVPSAIANAKQKSNDGDGPRSFVSDAKTKKDTETSTTTVRTSENDDKNDVIIV